MLGVLRSIARGAQNTLGKGKDVWNESLMYPSKAESLARRGYQYVCWNHYRFHKTRDFDRVVLGRYGGRGVFFVRDPAEVILSGYFYHRWAREPWIHESITRSHSFNIANLRKALDATCQNSENDRGAHAATCGALQQIRRQRRLTYRQLLDHLSGCDGVLVEAHRALDQLRHMTNAYKIAMQRTTTATTADLGRIMVDFDAEFERIFKFLGAVDVDDCLRVARRHDNNAPVHNANTISRQHAMDPRFQVERDLLKICLLNSTWFKHAVEPMRLELNYSSRKEARRVPRNNHTTTTRNYTHHPYPPHPQPHERLRSLHETTM